MKFLGNIFIQLAGRLGLRGCLFWLDDRMDGFLCSGELGEPLLDMLLGNGRVLPAEVVGLEVSNDGIMR